MGNSVLSEEDRDLIRQLITLNFKRDNEVRIFGFKPQEILVVASVLIGILAFYIRTNDAITRLIDLTDKFGSFVGNSDNYHSAITGVRFEQGKPTEYIKTRRGPKTEAEENGRD